MTHHQQQTLRDHPLQAIGRLPDSQILTLDVVLPLRDQAGLEAFITRVSTVGDPLYRQFLTPSDFAIKFGPTQSDYDTTVAFLKASGFNVYGGSFLGHEVQVKAPVSVINAAFHINMSVYQHPTEARTFYGPDREPTTTLPFPLWHISGLDNFSIPKPKLVSRDDAAKALGVAPEKLTPNATTGSGPAASFLGSDMRAAYYGTGPLTGAGQTLGLFEYLGTDLADLTTYFTNVGQTNNVPITLRSSDGTSTSCLYSVGKCDDGEQTLDMTQALGMAPGLANLIMFVGNLDTAIISDMTTHYPLSTTIGCSWGWTPADATTLDPYFQQMAAQGQNFFVASGDDSTWKKSGSAEAWPADDAWIVAVGGTDLSTSSAAGPWASETAWADSGGGSSPDAVTLPAYQNIPQVIAAGNGNAASTTLRNGPDVAANADFTFYTCGDQKACQSNYYGGTSFAAPMWAGFVALANQQLASNGASTVGFLNPLIYAENQTATTYANNFHDVSSGTSGSYTAEKGYDLVTGWGSPSTALITTLVSSPTSTASFFLTAPTLSYTVATSGTPVSATVYATSRYSYTGTITYAGVGTGGLTCTMPSSVFTTATVNTTTANTLSINTSGVTKAGTYTCTITGTSGSVTSSLIVSVTVSAIATTPTFSITPAQTAISTTSSTTDTITLTSLSAFAGTVALSCPTVSGITCTPAPSSVALTSGGTGASVLTINASGATASGVYNIVVTGTSGTTTATATIAVTVALPSITVSAAYTSLTATTPTVTDTITATSVNAFTGAVNFTCTPTGGITCSLAPTSATLASGGTGTSVLTINTAAVTTSGAYTVVVTGTDAATGKLVSTVTITVNVTVVSPDFTVVAASTSLTAGSSNLTDALTLTSTTGFVGSPALTCTATGGLTCSFAPTSVALTAGGTGTSTLTIVTTGATATGNFSVIVTATSGVDVHNVIITVAVNSLPVPSFTITAGPAITIASQGASGSTSLTLISVNSYAGSPVMSCAVTSMPQGATYIPTCSVTTPIVVTASTPGAGTLTINTTPQTLGAIQTRPIAYVAGSLLAGAAFLTLLLLPSRRRRWSMLAMLLVSIVAFGTLAGCGSSSSGVTGQQTYTGGTTLGAYVVTVTGTSGSGTSALTATQTVAVTVQ